MKEIWHCLKEILAMDLFRSDTDEIHVGASQVGAKGV
jgi:hypothetical protein